MEHYKETVLDLYFSLLWLLVATSRMDRLAWEYWKVRKRVIDVNNKCLLCASSVTNTLPILPHHIFTTAFWDTWLIIPALQMRKLKHRERLTICPKLYISQVVEPRFKSKQQYGYRTLILSYYPIFIIEWTLNKYKKKLPYQMSDIEKKNEWHWMETGILWLNFRIFFLFFFYVSSYKE